MSMHIVWTRIRRVAGIVASMVRLLSSSMADATMIHMSWMWCFLPFKGRLMPGSPNNSSKSEQDDRESLPSRATARVVPTIHGLAKPVYSRDDPGGRAGSLSPRLWGVTRSGGACQYSVYFIDWLQALVPNAPPALAPVFAPAVLKRWAK